MSLKILNIQNECTGCGACVSACPKQALNLAYNEEGFYSPELNTEKCIGCKLCERVCHCLHMDKPLTPSVKYQAFMLKSKDSKVVKSSSSGGAFTLLADEILRQGGIVYGARYNYQLERLEQCSTEDCSMQELRKSKYIESYMGKVIAEISERLKNGQIVLFCGTPCQVAGLKHYLSVEKINTSKLLLVRFVCHGVPSNRFFTEYKRYEECKYKSKMIYFDFRPKTRGWRFSDWKMTFANSKEVASPYKYNYYYYYFQKSNILRASCYYCKRIFDEEADITIGDFWGIYKYAPENKDQEGISIMLLHSEKGMQYLSLIKNNCYLEEIPFSAIDYIYREVEDRSKLFNERNELMRSIVKEGYMKVAKRTLRGKILKYKFFDFLRNIKHEMLD